MSVTFCGWMKEDGSVDWSHEGMRQGILSVLRDMKHSPEFEAHVAKQYDEVFGGESTNAKRMPGMRQTDQGQVCSDGQDTQPKGRP